ncbi:MAG: O-antigen ligase family protein [Lacipirellulaceae bacterium]
MRSDRWGDGRFSGRSARSRLTSGFDPPAPRSPVLNPVARFATHGVLLLLAALLVFQPLAFGAVEAWSEQGSLALCTALVAMVLLRWAVMPKGGSPTTWLWAPVAGFAALGVIQATPLAEGSIAVLAPGLHGWRAEALGETLATQTLSAHAPSTERSLRLLAMFAAVLAATVSLASDRRSVERLLLMVAGVGVAQSLLQVYQSLTGASPLYAFWGAADDRQLYGTLVNHSNFAQYVNLAIGATAALVLVRMERDRRRAAGFRRDDGGPFEVVQRQGGPLLALALGVMAVCLSLSRNGVLAMAVAATVVGAAVWRREAASWRAWVFVAVPIAVFAALCVGGFDLVYDRLGTLRDNAALVDRWELTKATARAWRDHPWFGIGLGTHELAFPRYDTTGVSSLAQHADNDYVQLLEEAGLLGTLFVAIGAVMVAVRVVRLMRSKRSSLDVAAFGLAYGLLAIAVHAASDFGQRVPAVASLTAISLGIVAGLTKQLARGAAADEPSRPWRPRDCAPAAIALALVAPIAVVVLRQAGQATRTERWANLAYFQAESIRQRDWQAPDDDYDKLVAYAEQAAAESPRDAERGYWLNAYRWQSIVRGARGLVELPAELLPIVARIADETAQTRPLCPTYGPPYALEGSIRSTLRQAEAAERLAQLAAELAPHDAEAALVRGQLAAARGDAETAVLWLTRAVRLSGAQFEPAAATLVGALERFDAARELAGADRVRVLTLARVCDAVPNRAAEASALRETADKLLRQRAASDDATPGELAEAADTAMRAEEFDAAAGLYRRALASSYGQVGWRTSLVEALRKSDKLDDALREARVCLRMRPGDQHYKSLVTQIAAEVERAE